MITAIFLVFVGMFAIAGTFISIEAMRRTDANRQTSDLRQTANSSFNEIPSRRVAEESGRDLAA